MQRRWTEVGTCEFHLCEVNGCLGLEEMGEDFPQSRGDHIRRCNIVGVLGVIPAPTLRLRVWRAYHVQIRFSPATRNTRISGVERFEFTAKITLQSLNRPIACVFNLEKHHDINAATFQRHMSYLYHPCSETSEEE